MIRIAKANFYVLVLLLGWLFTYSSCRDEGCQDPTNPDCENYDPCQGKRTINSLFKVRPGDRGFPEPEEWCDLIQTDTFNSSSVRFDIPEGNPDGCKYEWQIGMESEVRKSNGFEVSFSEYLDDGKWESQIPVTLTIRSPFSECLDNPNDTLITVTRNLFFTNSIQNIYLKSDTVALFKGFFKSNPRNESTLKFLYLENGEFRGFTGPMGLNIGIPNIDTLMGAKDCPSDYCRNYRHIKIINLYPENCTNKDLANYFKSSDVIFSDNGNTIELKYVFDKPSGKEVVEFKGTRIN
jgi:hypothetical protein